MVRTNLSNNRWPNTNTYSKLEHEQIMHMQKAYKDMMVTDQESDLFKIDEHNKPLSPAVRLEDFRREAWPLSDGNYTIYVRDIIGKICEYEFERSQRAHIYLNSPTYFFLKEFKTWFRESCNKANNDEFLKEIRTRIDYVDKLEETGLFEPQLLDYGYENTKTLRHVLFAITDKLKAMEKCIELELSKANSKNHFNTLNNRLKSLLQNTVYFLFYVLRADEAPASFNWDHILQSDATASYSKTLSFRFLKRLLNNSDGLKLLGIADAGNAFEVVNFETLRHYQYELNSLNSPEFMANFSKGLKELKLNNLCAFLNAHMLFTQLIYFTQLCVKAENLAATGGDILVYAGLSTQIDKINLQLSSILKELEANVESIYNYADALYRNETDTNSYWVANFRAAKPIYKEIRRQIEGAVKTSLEINKCVKRWNTEGQRQSVLNEVQRFIQETKELLSLSYSDQPKLALEDIDINSIRAEIEANLIQSRKYFEQGSLGYAKAALEKAMILSHSASLDEAYCACCLEAKKIGFWRLALDGFNNLLQNDLTAEDRVKLEAFKEDCQQAYANMRNDKNSKLPLQLLDNRQLEAQSSSSVQMRGASNARASDPRMFQRFNHNASSSKLEEPIVGQVKHDSLNELPLPEQASRVLVEEINQENLATGIQRSLKSK